MHAQDGHLAQEHVVGLVLGGHEHDEDAVKELEALEGGHAHVEEHAEQHRHGDVAEQRRDEHGQADRHEDEHVRDALLPTARPGERPG